MEKIRRIIIPQGSVDTLDYFCLQLKAAWEAMGISVWVWDMHRPLESREEFLSWEDYEDTLYFTMNFVGLSGESQFLEEGRNLLKIHKIPCYCLMVDHPMYYYKQLHQGNEGTRMLCVDKEHCRFMEDYYPGYGKAQFLPLGGTALNTPQNIPWRDRKIDVLLAGNLMSLANLEEIMSHFDEEIQEFCRGVIKHFIEHPGDSTEAGLVEPARIGFGDVEKKDFLRALQSLSVLDLYIRSYYREQVVVKLADAGFVVHVIGKDWEYAKTKNPQNIVRLGVMDSKQCLNYMKQAKIALNVMPWFKEGTHDRIYNGMLQECLVVTDGSRYLGDELKDRENARLYSLSNLDEIVDIVREALQEEDQSEAIAKRGEAFAKEGHTWKNRAERLLAYMSH